MAAMSLTAWWADGHRREVVETGRRVMLGKIALVVLTLVSAAGAITALGDTLFPSGSFAEGFREDFAATANFLVRLRVIHPALAVAGAVYLLWLVLPEMKLQRSGKLTGLAAAIAGGVLMQTVLGVANAMLAAPVALQLPHLLLADLVWIGAVLYVSESGA